MSQQEEIAWQVSFKLQQKFEFATRPLMSFQKLLFTFEEPPSEYDLEWITDVLRVLCDRAEMEFNKGMLEIRQEYCPAVLEEVQKKLAALEQAELANQLSDDQAA